MRINHIKHANGNKEQEQQESEEEQEAFETANGSGHAGAHHTLASLSNRWFDFARYLTG
jgi:hypothetical protein